MPEELFEPTVIFFFQSIYTTITITINNDYYYYPIQWVSKYLPI